MASRCISTLNELDKISDKIYFKHSKVKILYEHKRSSLIELIDLLLYCFRNNYCANYTLLSFSYSLFTLFMINS